MGGGDLEDKDTCSTLLQAPPASLAPLQGEAFGSLNLAPWPQLSHLHHC